MSVVRLVLFLTHRLLLLNSFVDSITFFVCNLFVEKKSLRKVTVMINRMLETSPSGNLHIWGFR
jgi:hypothetical protein